MPARDVGRRPALRSARQTLVAAARLALGAGLALLPAPVPASGHAIVLESSPARDAQLAAPPDRLVLRFNSKIEHTLSRATIEPVGGRPVALTAAGPSANTRPAPDRLVIPLRPLGPGTYVVRYRVLAADGHLTEGALRFTVRGNP